MSPDKIQGVVHRLLFIWDFQESEFLNSLQVNSPSLSFDFEFNYSVNMLSDSKLDLRSTNISACEQSTRLSTASVVCTKVNWFVKQYNGTVIVFSGTDSDKKIKIHLQRPMSICLKHRKVSAWRSQEVDGQFRFYIYIYVYIYVYMYVCMYVCMYACMHVCMYACMYVCMSVDRQTEHKINFRVYCNIYSIYDISNYKYIDYQLSTISHTLKQFHF